MLLSKEFGLKVLCTCSLWGEAKNIFNISPQLKKKPREKDVWSNHRFFLKLYDIEKKLFQTYFIKVKSNNIK